MIWCAGSLHGASGQARGACGRRHAAVPLRLPRRPPRPAPGPGAGAVRAGLPPAGLPAGAVPRLLQPHDAATPGPPHVPPDGDPPPRPGHAAAAPGAGRPGFAAGLQPPHGAGPDHPVRGAGSPRVVRHVQREPPLDGDLADPGRRAVPGPRHRRGAHGGAAGGGRRRRVPRGDHVPGALPAPVLGAVRRAHGPDRARGHGGAAGHLLRVDGEGVEVARPLLLLHEPAARLRRHVPAAAAAGGDVRRRREERRRRG